MEDIIESLKNNTIITKENIITLKNYISKKYPNNTSKENSIVFADCINKILDKNMQQFNESYREKLKKSILKNAVNKKSFTVNAADILNECRNFKHENDEFMHNLLNWINTNQKNKITHNGLICIIDKLQNNNEIRKPKEEYFHNTQDNMQDEEIIDKNCDVIIENNISCEKQDNIKNYKKALLLSFTLLCVCIIIQGGALLKTKSHTNPIKSFINYILYDSNNNHINENTYNNKEKKSVYENNLEKHLKYIDIDTQKLRAWLKNRNSILADEPYLSSILRAAKKYNINPLLLIAITGQEQGFVPRNNKYAKKIVNNPYNVYVSWKEYNTNIEDSSEIVAKTLINLSKDKPENADSIKWINRRYAEDKNWWMGVSKIFNKLSLDICK